MDYIFTDIIIHAKASSVEVMSVIIKSDNVIRFVNVSSLIDRKNIRIIITNFITYKFISRT